MRTRGHRLLVLPVALILAAAACGGDDDADTTAAEAETTAVEETSPETEATEATEATAAETTEAPETTESVETTGGADTTAGGSDTTGGAAAVDLASVCPNPIVVQTDWFPEAEHGALYQMIGASGEMDSATGRYSGPMLADPNVTLEIRSGGPFIGFQPTTALMYQDADITFGYISTDEAVQFSGSQPTTAVVAPLDINPQILMWDPEVFDFQSFEDIGASDATVLVFSTDFTFVQYLVGAGVIREEQFEGGYDGSPARFVLEAQDGLVQQSFVSNEVFKYENLIEEWMRPVGWLLIHDSGFEIYSQPLAVLPELLESEADCLEAFVPLVQQATIDYISNPAEVNTELVEITDQLVAEAQSFWILSEELNADAVERMLDLGIVGNGPDATIGNFDEARVQSVVDALAPIFTENGVDSWNPDVTAADLVTNEFIDDSIGL